MSDPETLFLLRERCQIHIVTGRGDYEAPHKSVQLSNVLRSKGIGHNLDMWGFDVNHDWPWWRKMLPHYIESRLGW
jgi:esterase/lipase superfamily enzyme